MDLEPYCADNADPHCTASWCYVAHECTASDTDSSSINPAISYSYENCGHSVDFPNIAEIEAAEAAAEAAADAEAAEEADACACLSENGLDIVDGMSAANY